MSEPTLGAEQLLPYEKGAASRTDVGGDFDDLAGALVGEAPTVTDEPEEPEALEAEGEDTEEVEASEDESDDDVPPDSEEDEPQAPPTYRVRVDGQELEVPLPELLAGYSRQADYTRKTTELATQRKALESDQSAYRQARDQYAERLPALEKALADSMPPEPDEGLRQTNPGEYAARQVERREHAEKLAAIRAEQDGIRGEQEREFHANLTATLQAEHAKLIEAVPEWKDESVQRAEKGKLVEFAGSLGWTPQDLDNVTDHRLVLVLRDAMRFREGQTKGKEAIREKVAAAPVVMKPGARPQNTNKGKRTELQRLSEKLERTGRVEDAAKLFENLDL